MQFPPLVLADARGVRHTFHVRSMLVPSGLELEAVETARDAPAGYRFAVLGAVDARPRTLFESRERRIRAALAVTHVEKTGHGWQIGPGNRLVGRIEWDSDADGRTPLLVIDGRAFAAAIGLYGVIAGAVAQRTPEIGMRVALGARRRDIVGLVLGQGARIVVVGLALGVGLALAITRLLSSLLVGVTPTDFVSCVLTVGLLAAVAIGAAALPARRASRLDPLTALRHQ